MICIQTLEIQSSWKPRTGFTNNNKTIRKMITFGIKNGPCETLPFFSLSSPFPLPFLFPVSSFTLPFYSPFLFLSFFLSFFVSFSVPFPFVFLSFSFRFLCPVPFRFLSFSFPFPFHLPFLSLSLLFLFLFPFLAHVNSFIKAWSQRLEKR